MLRYVTVEDFDQWLEMAKEVEPLFGDMVGVADFEAGIKACIADSSALCVTQADDDVAGIIAFSKETNEILWLAVKNKYRKKGYGYDLVEAAIQHLDTDKPIYVQTFAAHVDAGLAARKLYLHFGFKDDKDGGKNPAGVDTTIMRLG